MLVTAVEVNPGIIWLVVNNNAFGTIAGLQKVHYGLTDGAVILGAHDALKFGPDYAQIAQPFGAAGLKKLAREMSYSRP